MLVASISLKLKWGLPPPTFPKFTCQNISQHLIAKIEIHLSQINLIGNITIKEGTQPPWKTFIHSLIQVKKKCKKATKKEEDDEDLFLGYFSLAHAKEG